MSDRHRFLAVCWDDAISDSAITAEHDSVPQWGEGRFERSCNGHRLQNVFSCSMVSRWGDSTAVVVVCC